MPFSFSLAFCCPCFSKGKTTGLPDNTIQPEIDETSRLIPQRTDEQPTPTRMYVDQERVRERLGTIVRAKEGKMVNVMSYRHSNASRSSDSPGLRPTSIADEPETESRGDDSSISNNRENGEHSPAQHAGPSNGTREDAGSSQENGVKSSDLHKKPPPTSLPDLFKKFEDAAPSLSLSWGD
ncbi:hypothetical protein K435DRAFT_965002 [Dendrothele bispora CBS 962.96]|uniref:Uncharacterized protein n=1 Tax=Dendrothele bispora (strain CBS 962.96) TaxID=1314807 RepID=A0A4S8M7N1_DENBC|nr:hypothetical protein K435DRAFT_965002 [Dendrothele bispora CBS 962.96]